MSAISVDAISVASDTFNHVHFTAVAVATSTPMPLAGAIKNAVSDDHSTTSQIFTAIWSVIMWLIKYPGLFLLSCAVIGVVVALTAFSITSMMNIEPQNKDYVTSCIVTVLGIYVVLLVIFGVYNGNLPQAQGSWEMVVAEAGVVVMLACGVSLLVAATVWLVRWFRDRGNGEEMRKAEEV